MTTQEMLDEARAAYHSLMIGRRAVIIHDQNGEQIEYNRVSISALAKYIRDLEAKLAEEQGKPIPRGPGVAWFV